MTQIVQDTQLSHLSHLDKMHLGGATISRDIKE